MAVGYSGTTATAGEIDFAIARFNTDGSLDTTFDTDGNTVRLDCRDWGEMVSMDYPRMTALTLGSLVNTQIIDSE